MCMRYDGTCVWWKFCKRNFFNFFCSNFTSCWRWRSSSHGKPNIMSALPSVAVFCFAYMHVCMYGACRWQGAQLFTNCTSILHMGRGGGGDVDEGRKLKGNAIDQTNSISPYFLDFFCISISIILIRIMNFKCVRLELMCVILQSTYASSELISHFNIPHHHFHGHIHTLTIIHLHGCDGSAENSWIGKYKKKKKYYATKWPTRWCVHEIHFSFFFMCALLVFLSFDSLIGFVSAIFHKFEYQWWSANDFTHKLPFYLYVFFLLRTTRTRQTSKPCLLNVCILLNFCIYVEQTDDEV